MRSHKSDILRYGVGLASFIVCLMLAYILRRLSINVDEWLLIIAALAVAAWCGGTGPGLMVAILFELMSIAGANPSQGSMPVRVFAEVSRTTVMAIVALLVSARRKVERRLRDQREWLEVTLSSIDDAVIATGPDGRVTFMNPAAEALTGWSLPVAIGEPLDTVFQIVNGDSVENHSKALPDVILRCQDGTTRLVDVSAAPISNNVKGTNGSVLVFRDVTEHHRLQDQFRQAQKMEGIGRLAGGVAHDFNNLLTVIMGYCQLALRKVGSNKGLVSDLKEIDDAGRRATVLVSQLLAFSRKQVFKPQVLDLNEIVTRSEKMLRRLIGEDIDLVSTTRSGLGHVLADSGQIEQIIMNLAVNARDAMPQGGKLTLETAKVELDENYARAHAEVAPGRYVLLAISDTGHGMNTETQSRIFEPFYTTKELGKGTGLGLSTVFGIVKQSGGHIWFYSEPGKGATFKVYFPMVDEPVEPSDEAVPKVELFRGSETLLLAEDDEAVRGLAKSILEEYGYRVLAAASGSEAIQVSAQSSEISLLITDVVMPGMSGRELASAVEKSAPRMRILYLSGYAENAIVHHGVLDEGVTFLPKPFTPEGLAGKVREVLDRPG